MLVGYAATAPFVGMFIHRALWPRLSRLALPSARTLWIVPAFTIIITMLVGSAHIQHLMTGYELVYGMTSMLVVIFAAGVCLLTLVILQKNQTEANQKHDMEIVKVQIASQSRCYLEVMERMDEIRIMRHDLRHHTRVASMLLEEGNLEALRAFLGDAAGDRRLHDNIVYSHNHISDLVAHHSMKMAEAEDIQLSIRCGLPKSFWVSDADLCILLGNLMDNALNACRLQPSGARTISLTTAIRGEEAYIYMENSCGDAKLDTSAYRKKAGITQSGGYGISSVRNVAEKYNGAASFERQEGCFKSAVLLCHPIKTMDAATQERSGRPERMVSTTN